ncbi:MAG TPA: pyridoxal phosphate-dependent aminotransferase [bacterium]|nr:pyridoxal phosphate-dependent aminotransferase [bacterium]
MISKNLKRSLAESSWIRRMFEKGAELKEQYGEDKVFDFSLGNPDLESPPEFNRVLKKEAAKTGSFLHGYMANAGYAETREAVAAQLSKESNLNFEKEHIVMTVGAAGAMNVALKSILDPGDEVIVFKPYFVEYDFYIDNHQGVKVMAETTDRLLPDLDSLGNQISEKTKAVIINSPNNPTGRVYPEELFEQLANILKEKSKEIGHTIYLLADEPYKKIIFNNHKYHSPFKYYDNTLLAYSFSKDLSLAGERIGYLSISPNIDDLEDMIAATNMVNRTLGFINAPALMQRVIPQVLDARVDIATYESRKDRIYNALDSIGYDVVEPEGTFYIFPRSPIDDDLEFTRMLQEKLVLTTPGTGFHKPGYFRISFCVEDKVIEGAIPIFEKVYKQVKD